MTDRPTRIALAVIATLLAILALTPDPMADVEPRPAAVEVDR